jgi:hypothetical protein
VLLHTFSSLQQRGRRAITTLNTATFQKTTRKKIFSPTTLFIAYLGKVRYICPTFLLKRKRHVCKTWRFQKKFLVQLSDEVFPGQKSESFIHWQYIAAAIRQIYRFDSFLQNFLCGMVCVRT